MHNGRKRFAALAVMAVIASVLVAPLQQARAATEYTVDVGSFLGGPNCNFETGKGCVPADGMRFYGGPRLRVMQGDTVTFVFQGFHTATAIPENEDVHAWIPDNAGGVGKPYSLLVPDPDDTAVDEGGSATTPSTKANLAAAFPSSFLCGSRSAPCPYDGTSVVNSGLPLGGGEGGPPTFSMQITAEPGDDFWVICLVHTHMRLRITVVSDPTQASDPAAVTAAGDSQEAFDEDEAASIHNKLKNADGSHKTRDGRTVWDVQVGWDNHWLSLLAMYPKKLAIDKGDTVRFHFAEAGVYEIHTATFPFDTALEVFEQVFVPGCDPDGDAGPGPDGPPENQATVCNDPTQVEFDVPPLAAFTQGDGIFKGSDYENSGIRGADAPTVASWDLKFPKASPDKGFKYFCLIHSPFMGGKVIVGN